MRPILQRQASDEALADQVRRFCTECTYADWVRHFVDDLAEQQGVRHPRVDSEFVRK
jgi:hypothetical protein